MKKISILPLVLKMRLPRAFALAMTLLVHFLFCGFILILLCAHIYASPFHSISIDGDLSDFVADELKLQDDNDSSFSGSELRNLYLTWDASNIYIGVEGPVSNNGFILYIDRNQAEDYGNYNLTKIPTWNRKVTFSSGVFKCDFFYASWDMSNGNLYRVEGDTTVADVSWQAEMKASKTSLKPGWEIKIPFSLLYGTETGLIPRYAKIGIFASIVTGNSGNDLFGSYGGLGGDCIPNNSLQNVLPAFITNVYTAEPDPDGDAKPDNYYSAAKFEIRSLIMEPKAITPDGNGIKDLLNISFSVNKPCAVKAEIFDIRGERIKTVLDKSVVFSGAADYPMTAVFDGSGFDGCIYGTSIPAGMYILSVKASTSYEEVVKKAAFAVVK